nr:hypothetical protein [Tanacetum cinerariifolium]
MKMEILLEPTSNKLLVDVPVMRTSKHGEFNTSVIRRSYALSWKPCQRDSLNLPDHRYKVDVAASFQRSQIHKPHAHTQAFKVNHSTTRQISPSKVLLTPKSTPPPLISPPSAPTQPSKHSSPLDINLDHIELLFFTPLTSSQTLFNTLEDLPPTTTNPLPLRPSFDFIERLANEPLPIPAMEPPPPMPPQLPTFPPNPPSKFPPLPPLGPNNPFPLLTHEMFCEH